jgi:ATP-dependent helicase HrpA
MDQAAPSPAGFVKKNAAVVESLRLFEHKLRRPDVLVADDDVYAFYAGLIPEEVCDSKSFEAWRRRAEREDPERLLMQAEDLQRQSPPQSAARDFPDELRVEQQAMALVYRFEPGAADDGVTLEIPQGLVPRLKAERFEWTVPGLLEEKVLAMLKLLPKASRRELLPLAEVARAFLDKGARESGSLANALREFLRHGRGVDVPDQVWHWQRLQSTLAPHLLMNFRVIGENGETLGEGRDLLRLQMSLAEEQGKPVVAPPGGGGYAREGLRDWVVGVLPPLVEERRDGRLVRGYPALADQGQSVALGLFASRELAAECHADGVRRLFAIGASRSIRAILRELPHLESMELVHAMLPGAPGYVEVPDAADGALVPSIIARAAARAMPSAGEIRDEASYRRAAMQAAEKLPGIAESLSAQVWDILDRQRALRAELRAEESALPAASYADIEEQLVNLLFRGFLRVIPDEVLASYPRYLSALGRRLDKLRRGGAGDSRKLAGLAPLWHRFTARAADHRMRGRRDAELMRYLGTALRVSPERLESQWRKVSL